MRIKTTLQVWILNGISSTQGASLSLWPHLVGWLLTPTMSKIRNTFHRVPPHIHVKRHCSSCTTDAGDDARARKKESTNLKAARRVSLAHEEAHQISAREMVFGASSSIQVIGERITTDGAEIAVGTIEGDPSTDVRVLGNRT